MEETFRETGGFSPDQEVSRSLKIPPQGPALGHFNRHSCNLSI